MIIKNAITMTLFFPNDIIAIYPYICVCTYTYVCVYVCISIHLYMYMHVYSHIPMCVYIQMGILDVYSKLENA